MDEFYIGTHAPATNQPHSTRTLTQRPELLEIFKNILATRRQEIKRTPRNPETLLQGLTRSWKQHNHLCEEIDAALRDAPASPHEQIKELYELHQEIIHVDNQKKQHSQQIKPTLSAAYSKTPELPIQSFWTQYINDHATQQEHLSERYHRASQWLTTYRQQTDPLLQVPARKSDKPRTHTPADSREALLIIDNYHEYVWVKNLVGLPDYLLREQLAGAASSILGREVNLFDNTSITQAHKRTAA